MFHDTINPKRILNAVKRFWLNLHWGCEVDVQDWKETIPEDIRKDPVFEKYKEPAEAYRALVEAQKFLGREKLPVPADENDKDTINLILKRLGLPDSSDKYALPTDLEISEDLPVQEELINDFKKVSHELGILPQQFAGLYKWYMQSTIDTLKKYNEQETNNLKESETSLRKKWGAAYPQNVALAQKVFRSFADEKAFEEFEKGFGNNPVLIELFANIGKILSEDQLAGKPKGLELTPDEAMIELKKMEADLKSPLFDNTHPQHQEYVDKRARLYKLTYPTAV